MKLSWGENHALSIEMSGPEAYALEEALTKIDNSHGLGSGSLLKTIWAQLPAEDAPGSVYRPAGEVVFLGRAEPRWQVQYPPRVRGQL